MQTQLPVIRTYLGPDRESTQAAYRQDAAKARASGWYPVAHRWRLEGDQQELAVVFELRDAPDAEAVATVPAITHLPASAVETGRPAAAVETGRPAGAVPESSRQVETAPGAGIPQVPEAPTPIPGTAEPSVEAEPWGDAAASTKAPSIGAPLAGPAITLAVAPVSVARARARATIQTIDLHAGGEPLRLIRSGYPRVPLAPVLERRRWVREHADAARRALMFEPRGHRDMYGAVLLPPHRDDADIAVLFMHNEGYSTMCGHGVIALTAGLIEEGLYPASVPSTVIRWETPAGLVTATATTEAAEDGHLEVTGVRFVNVPSYLHAADLVVRADGVGGVAGIAVQLAFGGAYYGIVDAADLGLRVVPSAIAELTRAGAAITDVLRRDHTPSHPTDPDLGFVYGTIIIDHEPSSSPDGLAAGATMRNITVFADAEVDRSPCGSGTSAVLAWLHAAGRLAVGGEIANASITGEVFRGRLEGTTHIGDRDAVITSVAGRGYVTGYHTFIVDERDPLGDGFLLR